MRLIKFNGREGYNKLHHLPFNREFAVRPELTSSMKKYGFIYPILLVESDVVDGKRKMWIADGQNRALNASYLDIEFYGVVVEQNFKDMGEVVNFVAQLNSTQRAWTCLNYVEAFNYLGYPEYHKLLTMKNKYTYSVETIASLLTSHAIGTRSGIPKIIKDGNFIATLQDEAEKTMQIVLALSKYKKLTSRMVVALHSVRVLKHFNDEKFINKFNENAELIWETKDEYYAPVFKTWIKEF